MRGFLYPQKRGGGVANPKGNPENLQPVRTKDEAKKRGAAGGKKSGAARRKKRDVQQAIQWMFNAPAVGPLDTNLQNVGIDEKDRTNLTGIIVGLAMKAARGDVAAFKALADYGGFHPDQKQRDKESEARIRKMDEGIYRSPGGDDDDDEGQDVVVVLPDNGRGDGPKPVNRPPDTEEPSEEGEDVEEGDEDG